MIPLFIPDLEDILKKDAAFPRNETREDYLTTLLIMGDWLEDNEPDNSQLRQMIEWCYINEKWPKVKIIPGVVKRYNYYPTRKVSIKRKARYVKRDPLPIDKARYQWALDEYNLGANYCLPSIVWKSINSESPLRSQMSYESLLEAYRDLQLALIASGEIE